MKTQKQNHKVEAAKNNIQLYEMNKQKPKDKEEQVRLTFKKNNSKILLYKYNALIK